MYNDREYGTITMIGYREIKSGKLTYHYHFRDEYIHHGHDALLHTGIDGFTFTPHNTKNHDDGIPIPNDDIKISKTTLKKIIEEEVKKIFDEMYGPQWNDVSKKAATNTLQRINEAT